jgi:hypothetical protein
LAFAIFSPSLKSPKGFYFFVSYFNTCNIPSPSHAMRIYRIDETNMQILMRANGPEHFLLLWEYI